MLRKVGAIVITLEEDISVEVRCEWVVYDKDLDLVFNFYYKL